MRGNYASNAKSRERNMKSTCDTREICLLSKKSQNPSKIYKTTTCLRGHFPSSRAAISAKKNRGFFCPLGAWRPASHNPKGAQEKTSLTSPKHQRRFLNMHSPHILKAKVFSGGFSRVSPPNLIRFATQPLHLRTYFFCYFRLFCSFPWHLEKGGCFGQFCKTAKKIPKIRGEFSGWGLRPRPVQCCPSIFLMPCSLLHLPPPCSTASLKGNYFQGGEATGGEATEEICGHFS